MRTARFILALLILLQSVVIPVCAKAEANSTVIGSFDFEQGSQPPALTSGSVTRVMMHTEMF